MKRLLSNVHQGLAILILIGVILQFFFAGMGVFHAASFQIHRITGTLLLISSALLLLFAWLGRTGRKTIGFSALLFLLMVVEPMLVHISQPFVKALHPVDGLAIMVTCTFLVRLGVMRVKE